MPNRIRLALYDNLGRLVATGSEVRKFLDMKWQQADNPLVHKPRQTTTRYKYLQQLARKLDYQMFAFREQRGVRGKDSLYFDQVLRHNGAAIDWGNRYILR